MAENLNLSLKIEALVKGANDVKALGAELRGLVNQAKQGAADPTAGIGRSARDAGAGVAALTGFVRTLALGLTAAAGAAFGLAAASQRIKEFQRDFGRIADVARFSGVGVRDALIVARQAADDGLLPLNDAIRATSDLLERGFSLDQARELLSRFTDEAATATTSSAELGKQVAQAASATRDAGDAYAVYAASIGKTSEQLTDAERRQAEFAEELRRTEPFLGAAARAANSLRGDQDALARSTADFATVLGDQLEPALRLIVQLGTGVIDSVAKPLLASLVSLQEYAVFVGQVFERVADAILNRSFKGLKEGIQRDLDDLEKRLVDVGERVAFGLTRAAQQATNAAGEDRRVDRGARSRPRDTTAARLAEVRALAQRELDLVQENLRQSEAAYRRALDENLLSFRDYYAAKTAIEERGIDAEVAARREQLATERRAVTGARDEAERIQALARVKDLEGEIAVLTARRGEAARANAFAQRQAERQLADELARVDRELRQILGTLSGADLRDELNRQFEPLLAELANRGDAAGRERVLKLIDAKAELAEFQRLETQADAILGRLANQEASLNARREAGLITETQARQALVALYRQTGAEVEQLIPAMEALGIAAANPEIANAIGRMKARTEELKVAVDDVALRLNGDVRDAATDAFANMATGAKTAKDAGLDFVRSLRDSLARLAAERLVEAVFGPLLRGGGGVGGFLSSLLGFGLHAGGIAGAGHTFTRRVSPLAFALAPRYHLGGIAGDEVPAILKRGEEVLTEDDPRHRRNLGTGGTVVNIINNTPAQVRTQERQERGERVVDVYVEQLEGALGRNIGRGGGLATVLERRYGLSPAAGAVR